MNRNKTKEEWEQYIAAYRSSKQSAALWCKTNQINLYTLKYWISKFKKEAMSKDPKTQWLTIEPTELKSQSVESSLMYYCW